MTSATRDFDWDAARRRLQQPRTAPASDDAQTRKILDERARRLAAPIVAPTPGDALEVLTFVLSSGRYAIEHACIHEVVRLHSMTPVPGAPPCVAGVTNYHGNVLLLIDLRDVLGKRSTPLNDLSRIIVLGERTPEFGLLAERTDETRTIPQAALQPMPIGTSADDRLYRGVTVDGLAILDGKALLADPRFAVGWDADAERPSGAR
jgi:purine-binding chemotaxis protein CheW